MIQVLPNHVFVFIVPIHQPWIGVKDSYRVEIVVVGELSVEISEINQ